MENIMKKFLITLGATATLLLTSSIFADLPTKDETKANEVQTAEVATSSTKTITENLQELKDNLTNLAQTGADKFNQTLSNTYDQIAQSVTEIKKNVKDQKDKKGEELQKSIDAVKAKMEAYKKAGSKKQEKIRQHLVDKLEELNKNINEYNNDKEKANS
ncbi:unknown [Rickettsia conorii str. Malish 7]|uniref:Acyl-[acyl-carrier-protein]--UDP-N-acetylglucosamine O-acyltransferase n=2 Tax=Rickettsia conorii TaxID=781 RepID=Q92GN4_RICCN|nr:unknown [Rickettsia conorii str. Malish 7]